MGVLCWKQELSSGNQLLETENFDLPEIIVRSTVDNLGNNCHYNLRTILIHHTV